MIVCPACKSTTSVRETRSTGNYLRRRRICDNTNCNERVTTIETIVSGQHSGDVVVIEKRALDDVIRIIGGVVGLDHIAAIAQKPDEESEDG